MFEIQWGAKTKFKYGVQLFTTERIYQSLNIKNVLALDDRRHKCLMNIKKRSYQNTDSICIRLVYFLLFDRLL